ncbi:MAG: VWA domain-containing protein [Desulfuromonadaceae bacterium]|nr:VWA domain-containing protein [Desulfuromonadaceae bacterium]
MRFQNPEFFALLFIALPILIARRSGKQRAPSITIPDGTLLLRLPETICSRAVKMLPWMRLAALLLLVVALARPQSIMRETRTLTKASDLMIALDLSSSMLAEDSAKGGSVKNRLMVSKEVLGSFLQKRTGDRIGLIAFAALPYSAAPLTLDHVWLNSAIERLQVGAIEDGTALGDALLAALNRLRDKKNDSSTVILISDGRNNTGTSPEEAAAAAAALGIRVYTVGIGSTGGAFFPVDDPLGGGSYTRMEADLDEPTLRAIAASTGGKYFRADDKPGMEKVFLDIDALEKQRIEQKLYFSYQELFPFCAVTALLLFLASELLGMTLLKRIP